MFILQLIWIVYRLEGTANVELNDGSWLQTTIIYWGGNTQYPDATSIICFKSSDLKNWKFLSIIANASQYESSEEGPNEHDCTYLYDKVTLICVIRMDAGDGATHVYKYYAITSSSDNGATWSDLEYINHMGCARPRVELFGKVLIVTGGRMQIDSTSDILMWINSDANIDSVTNYTQWKMISLSYVHNKYIDNENNSDLSGYKFDSNVNTTSSEIKETSSYTSVINWDVNNGTWGVVVYDQYLNSEWKTWSMSFRLVT